MSWEATGSLEPRGKEARGRQAGERAPEVRVRVWPGRGCSGGPGWGMLGTQRGEDMHKKTGRQAGIWAAADREG